MSEAAIRVLRQARQRIGVYGFAERDQCRPKGKAGQKKFAPDGFSVEDALFGYGVAGPRFMTPDQSFAFDAVKNAIIKLFPEFAATDDQFIVDAFSEGRTKSEALAVLRQAEAQVKKDMEKTTNYVPMGLISQMPPPVLGGEPREESDFFPERKDDEI